MPRPHAPAAALRLSQRRAASPKLITCQAVAESLAVEGDGAFPSLSLEMPGKHLKQVGGTSCCTGCSMCPWGSTLPPPPPPPAHTPGCA